MVVAVEEGRGRGGSPIICSLFRGGVDGAVGGKGAFGVGFVLARLSA